MTKDERLNLVQLAENGWKLMKEGKPGKAREIFLQVLRQLPGMKPRAKLRYRRGESEIVINKLKPRYEPLSDVEALGVEARLALANCCLRCGLVEESVEHLENAVEVCPDRAEAYCELGVAYQRLGRENLSMSALRKAVRLDPALSKAHHNLAQHFVKRERLQDARKSMLKAVKINPDKHEYYLGLAACYIQQGCPNKALYWLTLAVKRFPNIAEIREALTELHQSLGNHVESLESARELLEIDPRNPSAYDLLATALFQHGELDDAIRTIGRLIRLVPLDPLPRLKMALLLQQKGSITQAMDEYQRVIYLDSEGEYADTAVEAMQSLDEYQMQQILMRAAEDKYFRASLATDLEAALPMHGYKLTDSAMELLHGIDFDDEPPTEEFKITYH